MHSGTSYSLAKGGQKFGSKFSQSHLKGEAVIGSWIHYIHELKKKKNYPEKQFYFSSINTILCAGNTITITKYYYYYYINTILWHPKSSFHNPLQTSNQG